MRRFLRTQGQRGGDGGGEPGLAAGPDAARKTQVEAPSPPGVVSVAVPPFPGARGTGKGKAVNEVGAVFLTRHRDLFFYPGVSVRRVRW